MAFTEYDRIIERNWPRASAEIYERNQRRVSTLNRLRNFVIAACASVAITAGLSYGYSEVDKDESDLVGVEADLVRAQMEENVNRTTYQASLDDLGDRCLLEVGPYLQTGRFDNYNEEIANSMAFEELDVCANEEPGFFNELKQQKRDLDYAAYATITLEAKKTKLDNDVADNKEPWLYAGGALMMVLAGSCVVWIYIDNKKSMLPYEYMPCSDADRLK